MMSHLTIELPYGRFPLLLPLPARARVIALPESPPSPPIDLLLESALDAPLGAPVLDGMVASGARVTVVISDVTRDEPRDALLRAVLRRLPDRIELTIAIATGTHGPCDVGALGIGPDLLARAACIVNHDGRRDADLRLVGETRRGTPVRVHRCVLEADLVVATGVIRPASGCSHLSARVLRARQARTARATRSVPKAVRMAR